ncbi:MULTISPECIES: DUF982 domain-containing protein [Sinorhizobium]|uniref:Uncharacterized protein DUF982 n=2 Tax=Sinorhizobium TaxID=28105 RepID=A0A4R2BNJ2_9HYPH|nr:MULTISPECIES: DUF982 domain-containing protein [Sinorhizobium]AUX78747.1 hypothetical protein NXT3_PB00085 [Sinorhizobium fredii]TCN27564.1 uncharacterized protein DUF982 [Sinorhizobium americanum]
MREVPWHTPLWVTLQNGMKRQFCGPYDALDFLENEWPNQRVQHARAVQACREALHHPSYANSARNCFKAACIEAAFACSEALDLISRTEAKPVTRHR